MVLGEPQILGQMKQAVRQADEAGTLGTTLHQLFQRSFSVAKEVRSSTGIGSHSISMAAAAVRLASQLFEDLSQIRVLFVGAGEMVELVATHFAARRPKAMAVAERRVALIVANSDYQHVAPLRNPGNDGKALAGALRDLGFEVREAYNVDLSEFGKVLKEFGDTADGADWAVIYFAGHGVAIGSANYLIPVDARLALQRHVEDEAMPLSRMASKVAGASKMQLVILDACRDNPFIAKMRGSSDRTTRAIGRGLASIEPESGMLIAYAARDGTTALDGEANSPYLEALVKHLAEPGLEINLLFRKVRDDVLAKTGRQQEPITYGSLPAQPFFFRR
jgi:hypothetical protein